jgi:hypothetical protein
MDKDAADVRLDEDGRLVEGEGTHSAGSGWADTRQVLEGFDRRRDSSIVTINDGACHFFERQGPAVIP